MKATLYASAFKKIIDNTKKFTRSGADSTLMQYIHLIINAREKEIRAEAVDGHRISIEYADITSADESFECYIKPNIPSMKGLQYTEIEVKDGILFVTAGDSIQGYRQPTGNFYKVDSLLNEIMKTDPVETIGMDPGLLVDALIAGKEPTRKFVKIEIRSPKDPVIIRSGDKNIKFVLPVYI